MGKIKTTLRERIRRTNQANGKVARKIAKPEEGPTIIHPKTKKPNKPKRYGIISDIHANAPALKYAIEDMQSKGVKAVRFLGDGVGYGGNPLKVLKHLSTLREGSCCKGNHDTALLLAIGTRDAIENLGLEEFAEKLSVCDQLLDYGMNSYAAQTIDISTKIIERSFERGKIINWLSDLPDVIKIGDKAKGTHGFQEDPKNNIGIKYVIPEQLIESYRITKGQIVANPAKVIQNSRLFEDGTEVVFTGHVHVPFAFYISKNGQIAEPYIPERSDAIEEEVRRRKERGEKGDGLIDILRLRPGEKAVINVGAIGISRREDMQILQNAWQNLQLPILPGYYVIYDHPNIEFHEFYYEYSDNFRAIEAAQMPNIFMKEAVA